MEFDKRPKLDLIVLYWEIKNKKSMSEKKSD